MRVLLVGVLLVILTACGGAAAAPAPTAQSVIDGFKAAGLAAENVQTPARDPNVPIPNSYQERVSFTIPALGDKGGQVFVCDTKQNCDAIFSYFDALKALAGPYLYRDSSGRVVVQLNSGLAADQAAKYQAALP